MQSSAQDRTRLSFFLEASIPFTNDAWPFSFRMSLPYYALGRRGRTTAASQIPTILSALAEHTCVPS